MPSNLDETRILAFAVYELRLSKVGTQWQLFCPVHNIEKLAHSGWRP